MTKKEIKEQIAYDEQRLKEVQEGYRLIPEYVTIQQELDELSKKKAELEKRQAEIRIKYREDSKDDLEFAQEELKYSQELLRKAEIGLDPKDYSDEIRAMLNAFHSGTSYGYFTKLQWVSDDWEYALFKVNSHSEYIGRMSGSTNSGAVWALFKIDKDFKFNSSSSGIDERNKLCIWSKEGGRWGEKRDMELVLEAIDNYENNTFMSEFMQKNGFNLVENHYERGWFNEDIKIKYTTERTPQIGLDKGKVIVTEHERVCSLRIHSSSYYIDMPNNEEELKAKYPDFWEEWQKHK
jgi:hypothetical protein